MDGSLRRHDTADSWLDPWSGHCRRLSGPSAELSWPVRRGRRRTSGQRGRVGDRIVVLAGAGSRRPCLDLAGWQLHAGARRFGRIGWPSPQIPISANRRRHIGRIRASLWLGLPLLPAIMLSNAMSPIVQFRAAEIGEGAVATYAYAYRFHAGIMQVLVIGVGTVLLPHFGALWMKKQTTEILKSLLRRLSRLTVLASGLITAGVFDGSRIRECSAKSRPILYSYSSGSGGNMGSA